MCAGASAGGGGAAGLATNLFTVFLMRPTPGGNTEIKTDERCATLLALDAEPKRNRDWLPRVAALGLQGGCRGEVDGLR